MQEMTHRYSRGLDIFYNEHKDACTNCRKSFQNGMSVHLGDIEPEIPAVLCDDCAHLLTETVARYCWMEPEYEKVLPEATLWRYMDLAKFISLISKRKLFLPPQSLLKIFLRGQRGLSKENHNGIRVCVNNSVIICAYRAPRGCP